ncbi:MAG: F0F1 ATP synthase subunit delta [Puniceicoccales bacterium]|jgi:hypothetical protein|nr:F0F1 ATP synthase subunit delta [Puniceicoccales bacterium]
MGKDIRSCARRLAGLLLDVGPERRGKALRELRTLDPLLRRRLLLSLERELVQALRRRAALLEHAGTIAPATVAGLEKSISQKMGCPVHFTVREEPSLVGGLRVTCWDRRWECSLRATLDRFVAGGAPSLANGPAAA